MRRTDQTLLDQMQITDAEITRRMDLLFLSQSELKMLFDQKALIENNIDEIVDEFYERQTEVDEISLLIGDSDTLSRLRLAQRKYVLDLFSGHYDREYVNNRLRIGMVHKRIGVDPKLYLSAVRTLKTVITKNLIKYSKDSSLLSQVLEALDKLLYFDTTLVFDTYIGSLIGEIENEKKRTEVYAKSLEVKVAQRTKQLEEQARLDPLTNIYNQKAMRDLFRRELSLAKRNMKNISVVYFDVDNFKQINDKHGHLAGDDVLKHIGESIIANIRETDIPCRYGGDEFCIILPDCNTSCAESICQKIIDSFIERYPYYTLSIGISGAGIEQYLDENELIKIADTNMYKAKKETGFHVHASKV